MAGKVLAALADHADQRKLTCWPSVETLGRETRVSERGVRYALRSLEAIGAIFTERSRGRTSSVYRLAIPANHAIYAPFNPAESEPNPARLAPFNPARLAPKQSKAFEQSKKQKKQQQPARVRETGENKTAAAATHISQNTSKTEEDRHVCPKCSNNWPKKFGTTCFRCQCDVERAQAYAQTAAEHLAEIDAEEAEEASEAAERISEEAKHPPKPTPSKIAMRLSAELGGQLPDSWLHNQELSQLIGNRDFREVSDIMVGIGMAKLPAPKAFFDDYAQHLLDEQIAKSALKALFLKATGSVGSMHNPPVGISCRLSSEPLRRLAG